jgi:hypothetical protein
MFDRGDVYYILTESGEDIGEGPWDSEAEARNFLNDEVGVPNARIVRAANGAPVAQPTASPTSEKEWTDLYERASNEGLSIEVEMDGERSVQRISGPNARLAFKRQKGTVDALNALLNCLNT